MFELSGECDTAFGRLHQVLVRPPVLVYPGVLQPFKLYMDASNLATFDKEFLAIFWAVSSFRPYLLSRRFMVVINHKQLLNLRSMKLGQDPSGCRERWCQ